MESILIVIMFIATLLFLVYWQKEREKSEELRFREFVIANKAKDVVEYATALPSLEEEELPVQDELVDVNEVSPETLLYAIKQEQEDK